MPERPSPDEFAEYYGPYVAAVPDGPIIDYLEDQGRDMVGLLTGIPEERGGFRYEPGKWSVKELVGHVVDSERMFAMRALAFARKDPAALPPFDENDYAAESGAELRQLAELREEFDAVRRATVLLFRGLTDDAWSRRGIASDREFSVRGLAWIIGGHATHHAKIVRERYLSDHVT